MTATQPQGRATTMRRVPNHGGEPQKGDYWTVQMAGEASKPQPELPTVIVCCPGCAGLYELNAPGHSHHRLESVEPLTVSPSVVCPPEVGCHYFIRNGEVQWC